MYTWADESDVCMAYQPIIKKGGALTPAYQLLKGVCYYKILGDNGKRKQFHVLAMYGGRLDYASNLPMWYMRQHLKGPKQ